MDEWGSELENKGWWENGNKQDNPGMNGVMTGCIGTGMAKCVKCEQEWV